MFRRAATVIILAHLAVNFMHGAAHSGAAVPLSALQNAFVWIVILVGPLVALWMIRTGRRFGPELLALTMGGSLAFGIVNHFVIESPDHVGHITSEAWRLPFQLTALALAVLEAAGTAIGIRWSVANRAAWRLRHASVEYRSALSTRSRASSNATSSRASLNDCQRRFRLSVLRTARL